MSNFRNESVPLWAVTCYYNPVGYRNRRNNYRRFRRRLNVPLVAAELSFNGRFDLVNDDAEILLQIAGGDVMWQKERLLNIALAALPKTCRFVLFVDCDVVLQRSDWADQVCRKLNESALLQPFSLVHHLPANTSPSQWPAVPADWIRPSVAWLISEGVSAAECLGNPTFGSPGIRSPGHAWAARREIVERHGLYDSCIIGGGDTALACGAYGVFDVVPTMHAVNEREFEHYRHWAEPFYESVRGNVSAVEGDLLHLWHGQISDRRTRRRHQDMTAFQFDPFEDIAIGDTGCWQWNTPKHEMHEYVANYFVARNEDGVAANDSMSAMGNVSSGVATDSAMVGCARSADVLSSTR